MQSRDQSDVCVEIKDNHFSFYLLYLPFLILLQISIRLSWLCQVFTFWIQNPFILLYMLNFDCIIPKNICIQWEKPHPWFLKGLSEVRQRWGNMWKPTHLSLFTATLVILHSWKTRLRWQENVRIDILLTVNTVVLCWFMGEIA